MTPDRSMPPFGALVLLLAIFSAAICAIVYELLIGSVASYFLGNSTEQFSLTIGLFLAAMGLGSWVSRYVADSRLLPRWQQDIASTGCVTSHSAASTAGSHDGPRPPFAPAPAFAGRGLPPRPAPPLVVVA